MITQNALVTRATDPVGRAVALGLADDGFDLALQYDDAAQGSDIQNLIDEIAKKGRKAVGLRGTLLDAGKLAALFSEARRALGGDIAVLINNATQFGPDDLSNATTDSFDVHIGSNLKAPFVLSKAMADQKLPVARDETGEPTPSGLIVNVMAQRVGNATTKHLTGTLASAGLVALTQSSALELAPAVRVNGVAMDRSLRNRRAQQSLSVDPWLATLPFGAPDPVQVVDAVKYFLGVPVVTGQILCVEGAGESN